MERTGDPDRNLDRYAAGWTGEGFTGPQLSARRLAEALAALDCSPDMLPARREEWARAKENALYVGRHRLKRGSKKPARRTLRRR